MPRGGAMRLAAILGCASAGSVFPLHDAMAQSMSVFDPAYWSAAPATEPAQDKGGMVEKPRDDSRDPQRDVFQAKQVDVKSGDLREERPVGEYDQPQWTTFRRFP